MYSDDAAFEEWDLEPEPYEPVEPNPWRRRILIGTAAVTVVALAALPLYNLVNARDRPVADNGLEVCGFDYCVIQDVVIDAGLGTTMSRLANTFLNDTDAEAFAQDLLFYLGENPVDFEMVDNLDRRISGEYSPETNTIRIERPARAWIVVHEVAHVRSEGHSDDFQETLLDLATWIERQTA